MIPRRALLTLASCFAALAAACQSSDHSLGSQASLKCQQLPACTFSCPSGTAARVDSDGCTHTCECVAGIGSSDVGCAAVPACQFTCPAGTAHPVDSNNCIHTCECVRHQDICPNEPTCESACPPGLVPPVDRNACVTGCSCVPGPITVDAGCGTGTGGVGGGGGSNGGTGGGAGAAGGGAGAGGSSGALTIWATCGDPVCHGHSLTGVPACTTEKVGDPCTVDQQTCDPQSGCNEKYICASADPKSSLGCPISRSRYKEQIHYLAPGELARFRDELLAMKLATWRYKQDPAKERLGFMIDDNEQSVAADSKRDVVDLYGYTSMAVATIQLQAKQIEALQAEVAALKQRLPRDRRPGAR
jgi:hypothetical protein